jgi:hypothetical protein
VKRVQRTRRGPLPPGAVYVGRPTRYGNPYRVGEQWPHGRGFSGPPMSQLEAVHAYAVWLRHRLALDEDFGRPGRFLDPLREAKALACWCPLDQPCHADVLIEALA